VSDRLAGFDFAAHNAEVREMWAAYNARKPYRIPIIFGVNARYFMPIREVNPEGIDFRRYTEDPEAMYRIQLECQRWSRFNLLQDAELGLPEKWPIHVDFQNYYEAAWFGCPVEFRPNQVPDTVPIYADRPEAALDRGLPEPNSGIMAKGLEYYETYKDLAARADYLGRPVDPQLPWFCIGSDGPMTVACNLFGPQFVCTAMAAEPERLQRLLEFITEATVRRLRYWRERFGVPVPQEGFGMADDSIALISTPMMREHILPHLRRLYDTFGTPGPRSIHLCGDATRHFVTLRDELNIQSFDTGFPVDFAWLRAQLGPDVQILGGPTVEFLRTETPERVREEVRRILQSGVLEGGRFTLREGNNLAPHTPLDNLAAMYEAGREYGRLLVANEPHSEEPV